MAPRKYFLFLFPLLLSASMLLSGCPKKKSCTPSCSGVQCGADGCGGSCGSCDQPPADSCLDGDTLAHMDSLGQCLAGVCDYQQNQVDCPHGCSAGACLDLSCAHMDCLTPPSPCHEAVGSCVESPQAHCEYSLLADGSACDDSLYCNGAETCLAGQCQAGTQVQCPAPSGSCKLMACDEALGDCLESNMADGTACDDGDPCTASDVCQAGQCLGGTNTCTDRNVVVLMYMAADNDLDEYMYDDFLEMEAAGVDSYDWLRVLVLIDRHAQSAWSDTRLYEVHSGYSQELDGQNLGLTTTGSEELNLADGQTVTAFLQDARQLVGADADLFLIMSDHGDGWWRRAPTEKVPGVFRGCCYDEASGDDYLANEELHQALSGQTLALIGFDACLQGMAEVAYTFRNDAPVLVGSPELEGGWGWQYTSLFGQFGQGGDRSAEAFGTIAADTFLADSLTWDDHVATLAVYDLTQVEALAQAAQGMASAMRTYGWTGLMGVCDQLDWYGCEGQWCEDNTDFYDLAEKTLAADSAGATAYQAVLDALDQVILYEVHSTGHPNGHGMSVYLPCYYEAYTEYADTTWSQATGWYDMIIDY